MAARSSPNGGGPSAPFRIPVGVGGKGTAPPDLQPDSFGCVPLRFVFGGLMPAVTIASGQVMGQQFGLAFDEIGTSQRRNTQVRLTHRWREVDSNLRFRMQSKRGLRRKSPASAGRSSAAAVGGHQLRRQVKSRNRTPIA